MAQNRAAKASPRPTHIHVGVYVYTIEYLDNQEWEAANEDDGDMGACRPVCGSIRIRDVPNVSEQVIRETLLHEVLHAVWHATNLNNTIKEVKDVGNTEEFVVGIESHMLLQVLIDNPQFVEYLRGE